MRNETTTPKGNDNRVKVFISSRCEPKEKYGTFRRSLKKLLTETNLCSVFIFEDGASTQTAEQYYQTQIPQSDVVIFFLDNDCEKKRTKKSSPDGVLQEYKESKKNKLKIFFFYSGNDKNKTEFQKELEKDINSPKWLKIDDFTKAADEIYDSVINDILLIYKNYCADLLKSSDNILKDNAKPIGETSLVVDNTSNFIVDDIPVPNKNSIRISTNTYINNLDFNQFSQTYAVLAKALRNETPDNNKVDYYEPLKISDLDLAIAPLLAYIIGHGNKDAIDFNAIKTQVTSLHSGMIAKFVSKRIEIIEKYVYGTQIDDLHSSINSIYKFAKDNKLPGWILFDILIDNRNIDAMTAERMWLNENNREIQERLNTIKESYYPTIDRLETEINNECYNEQFKHKTKNLGTVTIGERLWGLYSLIKSFIIAISNGSLFHTFYTAIKLEKLLYSYMTKYANREYFIEYTRIKLVSSNVLNELDAFIRERLGNDFNALEAKSIWNSVCNLPEYYNKKIKKYHSIKLLWDYFDDDTFMDVTQWLLDEYGNILRDIKNETLIFGKDENYFETLSKISPRLTQKKCIPSLIILL